MRWVLAPRNVRRRQSTCATTQANRHRANPRRDRGRRLARRTRTPLAFVAGGRRLVLPSRQRYRRLLPAGSVRPEAGCENFPMTVVPEDFVPGLNGVVAFTTEIAEPDKDGGALRYRGVDIEDLVSQRVT